METVFMAMSGGFDSSFAAYLLKQQGYKVVGITFQLLPESHRSTSNPKACCSAETVHRAQRAARELGISHYVLNLREDFQRFVIDPFIDAYRSGYTPNPCILCNRFIKFSSFARKAFSIGADRIATGHYAVISQSHGHHFLCKGVDTAKDQSYFLYPIERGLLKKTLFPVGGSTKTHLKEEARKSGWNIHTLQESQDICFIPGNDYRAFLSSHIALKEGPVYLVDGTLVGKHGGIHLYTIGQRKGLNIPYTKPLYVVDLLPDENILIVGDKEDLNRMRLTASEINLLSEGPSSGLVTGKVRYRQKEEPCTYAVEGECLKVTFSHPVGAITPGQSVVLYDGDVVVGGGTIERDPLPATRPSGKPF